MTKPIRPNEFAQAEIDRELKWYENESAGLGDRLWQDIQARLELISTYPGIGEVVRRRRIQGVIRRFPLRDFPFLLIYREFPDYLELVALAHTNKIQVTGIHVFRNGSPHTSISHDTRLESDNRSADPGFAGGR